MKSQYSAIDNTSNFDGEIGADLEERGSIKSDDEDNTPNKSVAYRTKTELKEKHTSHFEGSFNGSNDGFYQNRTANNSPEQKIEEYLKEPK